MNAGDSSTVHQTHLNKTPLMTHLKKIEWLGSVTGLLGAGLLALNSSISGYGFIAFLISNCCWIAFGISIRSRPMIAMQAGFTATSLVGIYRWLG